ncbi:MAG: hypothetical protein LUE88_05860, partial [Clostridiales bacterium]|nr:hypothetical protein [Clostridiales bacterium]
LRKIINDRNFDEALKIINNKGLLSYTTLPNEFGWKKDYYIDYVIRIAGVRDDTGERLRNVFREYINLI